MSLSAPLAQLRVSETGSTWTLQEPILDMSDNSGNNNFSDLPDLDMDWQLWSDIAAELEPSLEFWDVGGL